MPELISDMQEKVSVYVGLGSNLHDPGQQIICACDALGELAETDFIRCSSLYRSVPLGPVEQPDYINAVAFLETTLSAHTLLDGLKDIERRQGRVASGERWGPRLIDLDILLYGDVQIKSDVLTIPHPGLTEREFVLYPLYEIAPALSVPGYGSLEDYRNRCPRRGLQCLDVSGEVNAS